MSVLRTLYERLKVKYKNLPLSPNKFLMGLRGLKSNVHRGLNRRTPILRGCTYGGRLVLSTESVHRRRVFDSGTLKGKRLQRFRTVE